MTFGTSDVFPEENGSGEDSVTTVPPSKPLVILNLREVLRRTSLSRATLYRYVSGGWFPSPVPRGQRLVGWWECDVDLYIARTASGKNFSGQPKWGPKSTIMPTVSVTKFNEAIPVPTTPARSPNAEN